VNGKSYRAQFQHWASSSGTGSPKLAWCQFGNMGVPVPELDI
jgi:hypothetical protein